MSHLVCRPWFEWGLTGSESEHEFEWPQKPWKYGFGGVGGSATAASGEPEAYEIREDNIVFLQLRVLESELAVLRSLLRFARNSGTTFTFRFDTDDAATEYSVYLHSPRWEDMKMIEWERDEEYPEVFVVPVALRAAAGEFSADWFALAVEPES